MKPYLLLALLWALYFHPLLLHPTQTLFAPYSDLLAEHLPARVFLVREWRATGELPLWNPYHFCGSPFVHDIQVGAFYPPYAVTLLFPESAAGAVMSWVVALHVLAAGGFTFFYARSNGLGEAGSLVAAVGWMFAGKWITHLLLAGHTITIGLAWLPLVLVGLERGTRTGGVGPVLGTGAALALMILGTHPQWTFYAGVFAAFWTLPLDRAALRRWLLTGVGAVVVALGLTAVQLLPTIEAAGLSARQAGLTSTEALRVGLQTLTALAGPGAAYDPPASWEARGLVGLYLLAAALVAPTLGGPRTRYRAWVLAGLAVFGLGGAALVDWLPGFNRFRVPTRMLLIAGFPVAVLAGTATDALVRAQWSEAVLGVVRRRVWLVVVVVALPALLWDFPGLRPGPRSWGRDGSYWLVAAGLLLPALGWFADTPSQRTFRWLAVLIGESFLLLPNVVVLPQATIYPPTPTLEYAATRLEPGAGRVMDWDSGSGPGDRLAVFGGGSPLPLARGVETPRGYNPLDVKHYREFIGFVVGDPSPVVGMSPVAQPVLPNFEVGHPRLFDLLNTRYLSAPEAHQPGPGWSAVTADPAPPLIPPLPPDPPPQLSPHVLYERPSAFPRAWVVPEARPMPPAGAYEALVNTDLGRVALLATERHLPPPAASTPAARIAEYRPNRVRVKLAGDGGGFLVLADVWYPGWVCRVDGSEVPVERADHAFRAVQLPPGAKEAVFTFEPRSYRIGWWVSVAALALVGVAGLFRLTVNRSRRSGVVTRADSVSGPSV
ncbi:YfhO family protein [Urbifossiella limnaea]|uniref:Bacterial membrane protein YfhO n=1 Tax=Urbifossiella limnaea TaxID=2528023 RepID=A0A517XNI7_9BACT|nr:YfhO family protein [Urbifossiella limnaea]QDU19071.1 Bacterial membrane protein YfhO [Urbifossiella limnaea]